MQGLFAVVGWPSMHEVEVLGSPTYLTVAPKLADWRRTECALMEQGGGC